MTIITFQLSLINGLVSVTSNNLLTFYLVQFLEQFLERECQSMNHQQCKLHLTKTLDDQLATTNMKHDCN